MIKTTLLNVIFVFCLQFPLIISYLYEKPIVETVWQERCSSGQTVMNDCNYCVCDRDRTFTCTARDCDGVDMIGQYNDAIKEYIAGMEGHGVWRSTDTACQPQMHYIRHELLCVCNDDGFWPNPVCREIFRVMYEVKPVAVTSLLYQSSAMNCKPRELILLESTCSVCLCGPNGFDFKSCLKYNCTGEDPIHTPAEKLKRKEKKYTATEFYANCERRKQYKISCRSCKCLRSNQLLCDNCDRDYGIEVPNPISIKGYTDIPTQNCTFGQKLINGCNYCHCVLSKNYKIPQLPVRGVFVCIGRSACPKADNVGLGFEDPLRAYIAKEYFVGQIPEMSLTYRMCQPAVQYQRSGMICVCQDNGDWPSDICREEFRLLYEVKAWMWVSMPKTDFKCFAGEVFMFGCFICVCSPRGQVEFKGCVRYDCPKNDPIFLEMRDFLKQDQKYDVTSFFAECKMEGLYSFGCRRCLCLENNHLLCDNCNRVYGWALPLIKIKPEEKVVLPSANCTKDQRIINDCNWCLCEKDNRFVCSIRQCPAANRFGEFDDLIREFKSRNKTVNKISRSRETECQPRVHYQRGQLICVCSDDGDWPSPVCREEFAVLYEVEEIGHHDVYPVFHKCTENRLFLNGCNVCLCSSDGFVDPKFCTHYKCSDYVSDEDKDLTTEKNDFEVYAECEPEMKYSVGCRDCVCVTKNRLLCGDCNNDVDSICLRDDVGKSFYIECNFCFCDELGVLNCTTKQCSKSNLRNRTSTIKIDAISDMSRSKEQFGHKTITVSIMEPHNKTTAGESEVPRKMELIIVNSRGSISCHDNRIYEVGCNFCWCFRNGSFLCTLTQCE